MTHGFILPWPQYESYAECIIIVAEMGAPRAARGDSVSLENRYLQDAFCYVVRSSAIVNADSQVNSTAHNETQGKVCPSVSEPRILLNAVMSLSAKEQVSEDGIIQTSQVSSLT